VAGVCVCVCGGGVREGKTARSITEKVVQSTKSNAGA
jgi:hypothetical protein